MQVIQLLNLPAATEPNIAALISKGENANGSHLNPPSTSTSGGGTSTSTSTSGGGTTATVSDSVYADYLRSLENSLIILL